VGRNAGSDIRALADRDARIRVTGTVADVRPYLWGAAVAVVPLRIGGGTRLKIYEAMAAKTPVVSTTIGAEGLAYTSGEDIQIADTPVDFAERCVELLDDEPRRRRQAEAAWLLVNSRFSWNSVARRFEEVLLERGG
jgi:glycosyltransferase involved in cell wall biosynthesis